jgi:hypothetical protein
VTFTIYKGTKEIQEKRRKQAVSSKTALNAERLHLAHSTRRTSQRSLPESELSVACFQSFCFRIQFTLFIFAWMYKNIMNR